MDFQEVAFWRDYNTVFDFPQDVNALLSGLESGDIPLVRRSVWRIRGGHGKNPFEVFGFANKVAKDTQQLLWDVRMEVVSVSFKTKKRRFNLLFTAGLRMLQ